MKWLKSEDFEASSLRLIASILSHGPASYAAQVPYFSSLLCLRSQYIPLYLLLVVSGLFLSWFSFLSYYSRYVIAAQGSFVDQDFDTFLNKRVLKKLWTVKSDRRDSHFSALLILLQGNVSSVVQYTANSRLFCFLSFFSSTYLFISTFSVFLVTPSA